jgi:hypothetical protein
VFHLELHKFPNNFARFNMSPEEMFAVAVPWARGEWIELGDRKWNPHEARLTILEGPRIPVDRLRVGRGWRIAQREAQDVTEQVLARARDAMPVPQPPAPLASPAAGEAMPVPQPPVDLGSPADGERTADAVGPEPAPDSQLLADSIGLQLLALLDQRPVALADVWELAFARLAGGAPNQALALAEQAVRSLLAARLIILTAPGEGADGEAKAVGERDVDGLLSSTASWSERDEGAGVLIRRAH